MKLKMNLMFTVMMVLTSSSQTRVSGPDHAGNFSTPDQTKDPKNELPQWTHNPAGWNKPSADTPTTATAQSAASTETGPKIHHYSSSSTGVTSQHTIISSTASASLLSAAADNSISSSTAANITSTTEVRVRQNLPAFSSPTDAGSKAPTSSRHPQSESLTTAPTHNTGPTQTSAFGWALVGPTHQEVPPKLNVEDEDLKGSHRHSSSPLDPLLAGLLSVFIVTTAIVFIALFFKFRQRTNHPEFHRLQDLPMDDLMEDTPLSRYTH